MDYFKSQINFVFTAYRINQTNFLNLMDVDIENIFAGHLTAKAKFQLQFYRYKSESFQWRSSLLLNEETRLPGPLNPNTAVPQSAPIEPAIADYRSSFAHTADNIHLTTLEPPAKRRRGENGVAIVCKLVKLEKNCEKSLITHWKKYFLPFC